MHLHIERWTARPAWRALSVDDRIAYLDRMESALRRLTEDGVRLLGTVLKEGDGPESPQYVAAWSMPGGAAQARRLDKILTAFGWHDYFRPTIDGPAPQARKTFFEYADEWRTSISVPTVRRN